MRSLLVAIVGLFLGVQTAAAQMVQQGPKLVGSGSIGLAQQGRSVALSSDGNTAIVGGYGDNGYAGAAWIFTRSGGAWSQQGSKLVGSGAVGMAHQGFSVSISADGNTAIVGGYDDDSFAGAAWVFVRSNGVWSQQGPKLVGTGAVGIARQSSFVSISGDGNTAIVGAPNDNGNTGAAWIFTRSGGVWSQQGPKLVGTGAVGSAAQGISVSISGDGNTAFVGGMDDNGLRGAAWVFRRSGGIWSQEGSKLVGTGAIGTCRQGVSVSVSEDGNTAIVGGDLDDGYAGAAWVFRRSGGVWSQDGSKLVGTGAAGTANQGLSVSVSRDGSKAIVGGYHDDADAGAVWVFGRSEGIWSQEGSKLVGTGAVGGRVRQGVSVSLSADANTVIVGGFEDSGLVGAAWVFVAPVRLAFVQQPTNAEAGAMIAPSVTVQVLDASGIPVALAGATVTLSLSSGTGALSGTVSRLTDSSGMATFSDLSIDLVGSKQLTAASPGLASAVSAPFEITAGAATTITAAGGTPQSALVNTAFPYPLRVVVTDAFGNPVNGVLVTFTSPMESGQPGALLGNGGIATTNASGEASVTATANGRPGSYTVTATVGALPAVRFSLTNLADPAAVSIPALDRIGLLGFALLVAAAGGLATTGALRG